ncbi:MAG: hypothetical protein QNJ51_06655 [Calothrix sp. MO_167.B12]|nr:hypothetical protein [Calothrix sp. MO_167.B12]
MQHPFSLKISDLESQLSNQDSVEELEEKEANSISGGLSIFTSEAFGEEGGCDYPIKEPIFTTKALGEEGGWCPEPLPKPIPKPIPIDPPDVTTLAIGEEGGECLW